MNQIYVELWDGRKFIFNNVVRCYEENHTTFMIECDDEYHKKFACFNMKDVAFAGETETLKQANQNAESRESRVGDQDAWEGYDVRVDDLMYGDTESEPGEVED